MSDSKAAWDEVGSAFSGLGLKLKMHFEQARSESHAPAPGDTGAPGDTATGAAATGTDTPGDTAAAGDTAADTAGSTSEEHAARQRAVREALRKLGDALDGAFDALGAAVRDPAMKEDVKHVGQSLGTALSSTFADAGEELRKAFKRSGSGGRDAEAATEGDGSGGDGSGGDGSGGGPQSPPTGA